MKRFIRKLSQLNKNKKQLGEMVLVVSLIYTYFIYNSITRGHQYEQRTTTENF